MLIIQLSSLYFHLSFLETKSLFHKGLNQDTMDEITFDYGKEFFYMPTKSSKAFDHFGDLKGLRIT